MEIHIQWFGLCWTFAVLIALVAAVFLVVVARRLGRQGKPTGLFQLGAGVEAAVLVLDIIIRLGASSLRPEHAGAADWGLRLLDAWTIARPLAHAAVLVLVAFGLRRLTGADRPGS